MVGDWPQGIKIYRNKLYDNERLCVPDELLPRVVEEHHVASGHLGVDRLVEECMRKYYILYLPKLKKLCVDAKRHCVTCQQCDPPSRQKKGRISKFPIHPYVWNSIAMDMFAMPEEIWQGERYNKIFIVVDRHSGWIIGIPTEDRGLTAEKAAKLLYSKWLDMGGGIPSIITSDQGSQFIGGWFKTMCSQLGVRQTYSQAYRAQANGRAERAGRQIIDILSKFIVDEPLQPFNWVEMLPRVLLKYHDSIGESGYSP